MHNKNVSLELAKDVLVFNGLSAKVGEEIVRYVNALLPSDKNTDSFKTYFRDFVCCILVSDKAYGRSEVLDTGKIIGYGDEVPEYLQNFIERKEYIVAKNGTIENIVASKILNPKQVMNAFFKELKQMNLLVPEFLRVSLTKMVVDGIKRSRQEAQEIIKQSRDLETKRDKDSINKKGWLSVIADVVRHNKQQIRNFIESIASIFEDEESLRDSRNSIEGEDFEDLEADFYEPQKGKGTQTKKDRKVRFDLDTSEFNQNPYAKGDAYVEGAQKVLIDGKTIKNIKYHNDAANGLVVTDLLNPDANKLKVEGQLSYLYGGANQKATTEPYYVRPANKSLSVLKKSPLPFTPAIGANLKKDIEMMVYDSMVGDVDKYQEFAEKISGIIDTISGASSKHLPFYIRERIGNNVTCLDDLGDIVDAVCGEINYKMPRNFKTLVTNKMMFVVTPEFREIANSVAKNNTSTASDFGIF